MGCPGSRAGKALLALALVVLGVGGCVRVGGTREDGVRTADASPRERAEREATAPVADPAPAASAEVVIDNFTFRPAKLTVAAGTRVTWVNRDDVPHTATSTARPKAFNSGTLDTDEKFAHVFTTPGVYEYFCAVHPKMLGRIIVK